MKKNTLSIVTLLTFFALLCLISSPVMAEYIKVPAMITVDTMDGDPNSYLNITQKIANTPIPNNAIPGALGKKLVQKKWNVWFKPGFYSFMSHEKLLNPNAPDQKWSFGYGIDPAGDHSIIMVTGAMCYSVKTIEEKTLAQDWKYGIKAGTPVLVLYCEDCICQVAARFDEPRKCDHIWTIILAETPKGWKGELTDKNDICLRAQQYYPGHYVNPLDQGYNMTHAVEL